MSNVLEFHGLATCIADPLAETDAEKLSKAKCRIVIALDESVYAHVENITNPSEMWKTLKDMYDDKGLSRRIGLLRQSISIRLENCSTMSEYVSKIIGTANKLSGIGFKIDQEWIGAILLAGLTGEYKSFMGIESSGIGITGDKIKSKLLESDYGKTDSSAESAFFGAGKGKKGGSKNRKFRPKCFNCGMRGHISKKCKAKQKSDVGRQRRIKVKAENERILCFSCEFSK